MYLKDISLRHVRNYRRLDTSFGPGVNLFFGENAQGKTNLLEAVCILASLRSFRGVKAPQVLSWDEPEGLISGRVCSSAGPGAGDCGPGRRLQVGISRAGRRILMDGKRPADIGGYLLALKVSSFSPEDLFLVKEYPSHRRRFLDRSVFHTNPAYIDHLTRYRAAVKQMNAALKSGDAAVVASWEETAAPLAAEVNIRRRERAAALAPLAAEIYEGVLGGGGLGLSYRTAATGDDREALTSAYLALFGAKRAEGMRKGHMPAGPHTDDLALTLDGREMRHNASRGQSRLALLALVLADAGLYKDARGEYPVLLLDDVTSELDHKRRDALIEYVSGMGQSLITSTEPWLEGRAVGRSFRVLAGEDGAYVVPV